MEARLVTGGARFTNGSGVPLVTPFRDGAVDLDAFAGLVEFQVEAQTDALVVCGSTGENGALSLAERGQLIEAAIDAARGRIAVIAATGCETEAATLALSERATAAGADGLLVITPRATAASQEGVVAYLSEVAARTELPVYIYNYPARTQVDISAESIERLALAHSNIVGLKQTDGNLRLVTQVRRRLGPDFHVFVGIEHLGLPGLALGSAGMITAAANIVPRQIGDLVRAFRAGRFEEARRLHDALSDIFDAIVYADSSAAAAAKYLLRRAGHLAANEHRLPALPPTPRSERLLDSALAALNDAVPAFS
jgi:4-hydroxy-tetrahydrodipicolinate synthase